MPLAYLAATSHTTASPTREHKRTTKTQNTSTQQDKVGCMGVFPSHRYHNRLSKIKSAWRRHLLWKRSGNVKQGYKQAVLRGQPSFSSSQHARAEP